jgi:L-aspartate oxidase
MDMNEKVDVVIVGTGVSGLYCALNLPETLRITVISKDAFEMSDSFLAQGGICVLSGPDDYDSFFEDTLKAGHYENNEASVRQMILKSPEVIGDLIQIGVAFDSENGKLHYTKEGAHTHARILHHKDMTGAEITEKLLKAVMAKPNIQLISHMEMIDLMTEDNRCNGIVIRDINDEIGTIYAAATVLATGGIGGLYRDSTNYAHLTGDGVAVAIRHDVALQNPHYIQFHPTAMYDETPGRRFLISESLRGEGAYLLNAKKERFVNELLPRDVLTTKILQQMEREGSRHVWLTIAHLGRERIINRFPGIYEHCLEKGIDMTTACIPVTPAQHYFMGGIAVDLVGRTSVAQLYAVGETACNGVHGANRLASNSLLESLVFAREAAGDIAIQVLSQEAQQPYADKDVDLSQYMDREKLAEMNKAMVLDAIERNDRHVRSSDFQVKCG